MSTLVPKRLLNSMTQRFLFLLIGLLLLVMPSASGQVSLHEWTSAHCDRFDAESFLALAVIQEKINATDFDVDLLAATLFYLTNQERERANLPPFEFSDQLFEAALGHSQDMSRMHFYSHVSVHPPKKTMSMRLALVGIDGGYRAENIYDFFQEAPTYYSLGEGLVQGWMESPGHRANILNPKLRYLGCGAFPYRNPGWEDYFWVKATQNFCSDL